MTTVPDDLNEQLKAHVINWNFIKGIKLMQLCTPVEASIYNLDCLCAGMNVQQATMRIRGGGEITVLAISDQPIVKRMVVRDLTAWLYSQINRDQP